MIDKILVLTLERCVDRQYAWLGASQMRDIPLERVRFVKGQDDKDYDSMAAIVKAAENNGFPFVEEFAIGTVTDYVQQTPGSVCQVWNYGRILRHISERSEVCLVIHDDKMVNVSFNIINIIINELLSREAEEFYVCQLAQRGDINEIALDQDKDRFEIDRISTAVFQAIFNHAIVSYEDFFLKKGIAGYDETMVLSPAGAAWILNFLYNSDDFYIFYDHFIHCRLTTAAAIANQNGKGVYCPALSGYDFVRQIMPMATTTHFAPEGTVHFEQAQLNTDVVWENVK